MATRTSDEIDYELFGSEMQYVEVTLDPGEMVAPPTFAQASAQFDPDYFLRPIVDRLHHQLEVRVRCDDKAVAERDSESVRSFARSVTS